jgi:site-specific DNA-cytosine methylase
MDNGLQSGDNDNKTKRLTPRECARLMDFPETMRFNVLTLDLQNRLHPIVVSRLVEMSSKLKL